MLLVSLAVFLFWLPDGVEKAFFIALSVLVVTCPCALALATPTALTAATAAMRERGLLISKSHVLETLPQINRVVFDKTGTLTQGRLTLERVVPLADLSETELLSLAAGDWKNTAPTPSPGPSLDIQRLHISLPEQISGQGIQGQWQGLTAAWAGLILPGRKALTGPGYRRPMVTAGQRPATAGLDSAERQPAPQCLLP